MRTCFIKLLGALGLASCLLGASVTPASAQISVNLHLGPQPPPRHEYYGPPPRGGCFWGRGHWVPRGHHWVWVPGHWICR